jgi:hypothetical protein
MTTELVMKGPGDAVEVPQEGPPVIWTPDSAPHEITPQEIPHETPVVYTPDPDHANGEYHPR